VAPPLTLQCKLRSFSFAFYLKPVLKMEYYLKI